MSPEEKRLWLEQRKQHLTASDVAAVLGFNPYCPDQRVFQEKVSGEVKDLDGMATVESGQFMEAGIFNWFMHHLKQRTPNAGGNLWGKDESGAPLAGPVRWLVTSPTWPVLAATPDGICWSPHLTAVECKNTGHLNQWQKDAPKGIPAPTTAWIHDRQGYREDRSLRAPSYYVPQLLVQMHVLGAPQGVIVGLVGGQTRVECYYAADEGWIQEHLPALGHFWNKVLDARAEFSQNV